MLCRHPDKNPSPEAKETFQRKHAAYDRLVLNPEASDDEDDGFYSDDDDFDSVGVFFGMQFWEFM